jgi:hypothetical protein
MVPRGTTPASGAAVARVRTMAGIEGALPNRKGGYCLGRRRLIGTLNEVTLRDIGFILEMYSKWNRIARAWCSLLNTERQKNHFLLGQSPHIYQSLANNAEGWDDDLGSL